MHVPMCVSTLPHRMHLSSCQVITSSCLMAEMCNNTAAPKCALWNFCGRLKLRCGHVMARMKSLHVGGDPGSSRCVRAGPAVGLSGGGPRGWCPWGFLHLHVTPPRWFPLARWPRAHVPLPEACGYLQVSAAPPVASLRVATLLLAPLCSAIPFSP